MRTTLTVIALTITTLMAICSKNNRWKDGSCEKSVLINKTLYNNTRTTNYMITDAAVKGDCLEIKFGASGCNSKSWIVEPIDAEQVALPAAHQLALKLALTNKEMCTAAFAKTVSFDLQPLRIKGSHQISLFLSGLNNAIIYNC